MDTDIYIYYIYIIYIYIISIYTCVYMFCFVVLGLFDLVLGIAP